MSKSKEMENVLDQLTQHVFGHKRTDCIAEAVCVTCGSDVDGFRDALSEKEFGISVETPGYTDTLTL